MTINLGRPAARLRLPARLAGPVEAFMLQAEQPGEEGLTSRYWSSLVLRPHDSSSPSSSSSSPSSSSSSSSSASSSFRVLV